jgi:hypothetical protein
MVSRRKRLDPAKGGRDYPAHQLDPVEGRLFGNDAPGAGGGQRHAGAVGESRSLGGLGEMPVKVVWLIMFGLAVGFVAGTVILAITG